MRYVALLRGIGPMNPNMRNDKLRGVLERLGFQNVQTVVSSGNVLFDADSGEASTLESVVEEAWPEQLGFRSTTIIRTGEEMLDLVEDSPFRDLADTPAARLQVTFLKHAPKMAPPVPRTPEGGGFTIAAVGEREVCSVLEPAGSPGPDLMRWLDRTFGRENTTRSWTSVQRIVRKL